MEQENNRQTSCFMAFTVSYSAGKLDKCRVRAHGKTGEQAIHRYFPGAG